MPKYLSLMAGVHLSTEPDWCTHDCKGPHNFVCRVPPLSPQIRAIQWDVIEWIHGINALYPWDGEQLLREIREVMKPGGKLIIEAPDFDKMLLRPSRPVEWFFGDPGTKDPNNMAKWAYSPSSLGKLLLDCGYSRYEVKSAQTHIPERDFRIEAWK